MKFIVFRGIKDRSGNFEGECWELGVKGYDVISHKRVEGEIVYSK